ncbi:hypothetical protein DdX_10999 [Ditylenchus destructor]|uniref:Uncharacterized protein n=1 Tax=Ditylenchus destructor TaxID=166010 RepID=A0AAD4MZ08_9BILA|nr:hypothetical protein DdX_10999 [Ditylenchus destructor]
MTSAFVLSTDTSKPPPGFGNHVHRQEIPPPPGFVTKICDQYVLNSKSDFPTVSQFSDKNDSNVNSVCPENSEFVDSVPDHELDLSESGLFDFETTQKADLDGFIEDSYIGELHPEFQDNVILDFENLPSSQLFCTDNFEVEPSNSEALIFPNLNLKINFHSRYYTITYTGISESTSRILKFELNNNVLLSLGIFHNRFPPLFEDREIIPFPESKFGSDRLTKRIFARIYKSRSKEYYCLFSGFLPPDIVLLFLYFRNSESDFSLHSICNVSPMRAVMMAKPMPDFMHWIGFVRFMFWMCPMPRYWMPNAPYARQQSCLEPSIVNQPHRMLDRAIKPCLPCLGKCECREAID